MLTCIDTYVVVHRTGMLPININFGLCKKLLIQVVTVLLPLKLKRILLSVLVQTRGTVLA